MDELEWRMTRRRAWCERMQLHMQRMREQALEIAEPGVRERALRSVETAEALYVEVRGFFDLLDEPPLSEEG